MTQLETLATNPSLTADLSAILEDHRVHLASRGLTGRLAGLSGLNLRRAHLPHAILGGANLSHADLTGARLTRGDLRRADLTGTRLAHGDLSSTCLMEACLSDASLKGARMPWANLDRADLKDAKLNRANLSRASLRAADLRGANLSRADLRFSSLRQADLRGADLSHADLTGADLRLADLRGANLANTELPAATSILSARWVDLPPALARAALAFNAWSHPDPDAFTRWAQGGPEPYGARGPQRPCSYVETRELWDPSVPVPRPWDLAGALVSWACVGVDVEGARHG